MKSASQNPEKLDQRDGRRRAAEHEVQYADARRLAGELPADQLKLVVHCVEVTTHLIGLAQAETLLQSPRASGVFGRKALLKG
jgi:hypothetical protein